MNVFKLLKPKEKVSYLEDDMSLKEALEKMRKDGYSASPVLSDDGRYLGSVNEGDFLWFLIDNNIIDYQNAEQYRVSDVFRSDYNPAMKVTVTIPELFNQSMNQNFIPIVDDRNYFIGIVTRQAIINAFMAGSPYA